jgi:hypothetical protein
MCAVLLPPGVNPIAVKCVYIILQVSKYFLAVNQGKRMNNVSSSGVHIQETGVENMSITELKKM